MGGWKKRAQDAVRNPYTVLTALLVLAGVYFRLRGQLYDRIGFWGDEAQWATRIFTRELLKLKIRPLGYMWITKKIVTTLGSSEITFRLLSTLAGLGTLAIVPGLARRLFKHPLTRVLCVALIALHPACIDMTREFKPYAVSGFMHLFFAYLMVRHLVDETRWPLVLALALLPGSFLLGYDIAFAYPSLLLVGVYHAFRSARWKGFAAVALVTIGCLGTIKWTYDTILYRVHKTDKAKNKQGKKYGNFFIQKKAAKQSPALRHSRTRWTATEYADAVSFPGDGRTWRAVHDIEPTTVREIKGAAWLMCLLLHFMGLLHLMRKRRYALLLLFWLPILVTCGLNVIDKWPFGNFRANFYLLMYTLPIAMFGVEELAQKSKTRLVLAVGATTLFLIAPNFNTRLGYDGFRTKRWSTTNFYAREVFDLLVKVRRERLAKQPNLPPDILLRDWSSIPVTFYKSHHDGFRHRYGDFLATEYKDRWLKSRRPAVRAIRYARKHGGPVWLMFSKKKDFEKHLKEGKKIGRVYATHSIRDHHFFILMGDNPTRRH